jgi:formamidopyrimidine-DNA glycosylase
VYHRTGKACMTCGEKIEKIILGGRSTHFCSKCQKSRPKGPGETKPL